jgi:UDP-N-acetylglucosamine--N-acetylmuramyl-(pentapeptide) pyrophosphoryl-undecaprenol N-acetylglucosamine transferase
MATSVSEELHILFAGGGTGGHLYPGIAVAEELVARAPCCRISFCGTGREWERATVTRNGYDYHGVRAAPLVASPMGLLRALYSNGVGYRAARRWVRSAQPNVVVGLGGYASLPLCLAASRQNSMLVLLEQNVVPGRANRLLARWATVVCTMFDESEEYFSNRSAIVHTGNAVRRSIVVQAAERAHEATQFRDIDPVLVVLGGSQGAHGVNQFVTDILPSLAPHLSDWEVIHQTGDRDIAMVRAAYDSWQIRCKVVPFIEDIAAVYSRATLAIARAGATTLAELAVSGIPAVLLPYPHASANHQWHNAQAFGRAGAAIVLEQRQGSTGLTAPPVSPIVQLLRVPELRRDMRLAMLRLGRPGASASIALQILRLGRAPHTVPKSA